MDKNEFTEIVKDLKEMERKYTQEICNITFKTHKILSIMERLIIQEKINTDLYKDLEKLSQEGMKIQFELSESIIKIRNLLAECKTISY